MCAEGECLIWTLVLISAGGVFSSWEVQYAERLICAVKGSTVLIPCTFSYPAGNTVKSVKWTSEKYSLFLGPFLYDSDLKSNSSRYRYIGDKSKNCSLEIDSLEPDDAGNLAFRFETQNDKYTGLSGPTLQILDLRIAVTTPNKNEMIKEGDAVNLTCTQSCAGDFTFTWFRKGEFLREGAELWLKSLSSTESGNYSCSVKSPSGNVSSVVEIKVEYSPRNTSVSVTPSDFVVLGSNVTLFCSSDANPAVTYTWFTKHYDLVTAVGNQPEYHIEQVFQSSDQFFCSVTNKHGSQNSSVMTLKVKDHGGNQSRNFLLIFVAFCISLFILTAAVTQRTFKQSTSSTSDMEADGETRTDEETLDEDTYVNWLNLGQSHGVCDTELHSTKNSEIWRKPNTLAQTDLQDTDGCVIYGTVWGSTTPNTSYLEP